MVTQHNKSIMNNSSNTPPTAMPTIEAEDKTCLSAICITSMPKEGTEKKEGNVMCYTLYMFMIC